MHLPVYPYMYISNVLLYTHTFVDVYAFHFYKPTHAQHVHIKTVRQIYMYNTSMYNKHTSVA